MQTKQSLGDPFEVLGANDLLSVVGGTGEADAAQAFTDMNEAVHHDRNQIATCIRLATGKPDGAYGQCMDKAANDLAAKVSNPLKKSPRAAAAPAKRVHRR